MAEAGSGQARLADNLDDYSLKRVPASATQSTWDIALVRMGLTVSISDLLFGYTIGLYFSFWGAVLVALSYSVIIAGISILMGFIGLRERTSFALSSRFAFGREGSRLPSLVLAVIIAGFYGYILGITVDVFPNHTNAAAVALYSLVLGAVFLVISALGFRGGLKWAGRIGVPLMIILVFVADFAAIAHAGGLGAIVHATPKQAGKMILASMIALGVSKWLGGALITPDTMRFGRNGWAVVGSTLAEFVVGNFGFNLLGLILGLGLGVSDLGKAFGLLGITVLATIAFLIQSVTVEMNELYAASLAVSNALGVNRVATNIAVGVIGIVIGYYGVTHGIIASFLAFIGDVGYALPAIAGVMIADYFVVRRMRYPEGLEGLPAVNWRAVAALLITIAINLYLGLAMKDVFWHSVPVIPFVLYILLSLPQTARSWRQQAPAAAAGEM
jgi:cytosine permease